jgi:uncharacterized protein with ATP-grasp and redox domains
MTETKRALALGFFDGVHIGHAALLNKTKERAAEIGAMPSVLSFDVHPDTLVRGGEVLNDADEEDARQSGIDRVAQVVSSGNTVAGIVYSMLTEEARAILNTADVILSKGQGNYETLNGQGRHIFYAFLCKCELFTGRFHVPRLTGILVEENGGI